MKLAGLPGDDIGPEIVDAALEVLRRADQEFGLDIEFDLQEVGMATHRRYGTTMPDAALAAARAADGIVLGPAGMTAYPPRHEGGINVPGPDRKPLELFAKNGRAACRDRR